MNRRGHRGKVDGNQKAIVDALRKEGWLVMSVAPLGSGYPDLLAWNYLAGFRLIEVKQPKGKATAAQTRVLESGWPVKVVRSVEEAMLL